MKGGKSNSKKGDNKLAVKRKGAATTKAAKKAAKDPNKPKRPPSAFFVFMEEFRKHYKEKHPSNKSVAVVGKAGGDKWKSLTDDCKPLILTIIIEKAPYISKAEKRKADYEKTMKAYNKKQAEAPKAVEEDEDSDKSRSEVNDDEDDEDEEGSGEEDDDE